MTLNENYFNYEFVGCLENLNFDIDHVDIRGYLKILNVQLKIYEIKKCLFGV